MYRLILLHCWCAILYQTCVSLICYAANDINLKLYYVNNIEDLSYLMKYIVFVWLCFYFAIVGVIVNMRAVGNQVNDAVCDLICDPQMYVKSTTSPSSIFTGYSLDPRIKLTIFVSGIIAFAYICFRNEPSPFVMARE